MRPALADLERLREELRCALMFHFVMRLVDVVLDAFELRLGGELQRRVREVDYEAVAAAVSARARTPCSAC